MQVAGIQNLKQQWSIFHKQSLTIEPNLHEHAASRVTKRVQMILTNSVTLLAKTETF